MPSLSGVRARRQVVEPALTARQIAALHGVTQKTVSRWAEAREFRAWRRTPGGSIEVPVSAYQEFVERHSLGAAQ